MECEIQIKHKIAKSKNKEKKQGIFSQRAGSFETKLKEKNKINKLICIFSSKNIIVYRI